MNLPRRLLPSFRHPRTLLNRAFTVLGPIQTLPRYHLPLAVAASRRHARNVRRPILKRTSQTDRQVANMTVLKNSNVARESGTVLYQTRI